MGEGVILSSDQADALLEMPRNLLNLMESMGFQMTNPAEPDYHFVRHYFESFDVVGRAAGAGSPVSSREPSEPATADFVTDADEAPGDKADEQDVETDAQAANLRAAFIAGQSARRAGVQRRAVPPEYRARERSADAKSWLDGWNSGSGG
jgi:hypothetical protein